MIRIEDLQRTIAEQRDTINNLKAYIAELKAEERGVHVPWPTTWGLTLMEQRVAWAIFRAGDKVCTKDILYRAMYADGERDRDPKIIDVFVHKVRAKLRPMQIEIRTVWGRGYQFSPPSLAALSSILGRPQQ